MSLPKPSRAFTIPSIHDDTTLNCRLYCPKPRRGENSMNSTFATIIGHPYAPLGGCMEDPVVGIVGSTLLKQGYLVVTFNFRGANGSAGRTSWSAKPELADYVSVYGFLLCYLSCINMAKTLYEMKRSSSNSGDVLILAGYSYGSLIAKSLPPVQTVVNLFTSPPTGSAQAEIWLRAQDLSKTHIYNSAHGQQQDRQALQGRNSLRTSNAVQSSSSSMVVGGYESEAANRRISRESSRLSTDLEGIGRSVERFRRRPESSIGKEPSEDCIQGTGHTIFGVPSVRYLLVSPLLSPVAALTTMFSQPSLSGKLKLQGKSEKEGEEIPRDELVAHPTCVIFGTKDVFTSHKRLRRWAEQLRTKPGSNFVSFEVEAASHFWTEDGAEQRLRAGINNWLGTG